MARMQEVKLNPISMTTLKFFDIKHDFNQDRKEFQFDFISKNPGFRQLDFQKLNVIDENTKFMFAVLLKHLESLIHCPDISIDYFNNLIAFLSNKSNQYHSSNTPNILDFVESLMKIITGTGMNQIYKLQNLIIMIENNTNVLNELAKLFAYNNQASMERTNVNNLLNIFQYYAQNVGSNVSLYLYIHNLYNKNKFLAFKDPHINLVIYWKNDYFIMYSKAELSFSLDEKRKAEIFQTVENQLNLIYKDTFHNDINKIYTLKVWNVKQATSKFNTINNIFLCNMESLVKSFR